MLSPINWPILPVCMLATFGIGFAIAAEPSLRHEPARFEERPTEVVESPFPQPPGTYVVLFDFDSTRITAVAQEAIQLLLNDLRSRGGYTRLIVTAHADRSGPEEYNLALSVRRAEAVARALMAGGIAASQITIVACGESENAVQTPDGVKESANRHVDIDLQDGKSTQRPCW